jgi:two-component system sensor kinase FixL
VCLSEIDRNRMESDALFSRLMDVARISVLAELASGIAHEINQPLGAIAAFSQAGERLLDRTEPMVGRALDVFRDISQETRTAAQGIRRIAALFTQVAPERAPCQMSSLIAGLRPLLEVLARGAHAELTFDVGSLPDVAIAKSRIEYVIVALVQNALDACRNSSRPGRVAIRAHAGRYAVEVGVTDTGEGIAEQLRERLFEPFATTKSAGGGLGLAACHTHIEAHEGTIGFDQGAAGCRFWFRLPIMAAG